MTHLPQKPENKGEMVKKNEESTRRIKHFDPFGPLMPKSRTAVRGELFP